MNETRELGRAAGEAWAYLRADQKQLENLRAEFLESLNLSSEDWAKLPRFDDEWLYSEDEDSEDPGEYLHPEYKEAGEWSPWVQVPLSIFGEDALELERNSDFYRERCIEWIEEMKQVAADSSDNRSKDGQEACRSDASPVHSGSDDAPQEHSDLDFRLADRHFTVELAEEFWSSKVGVDYHTYIHNDFVYWFLRGALKPRVSAWSRFKIIIPFRNLVATKAYEAGFYAFGLSSVLAIGTVLFQIVTWLYSGSWQPLSLLSPIAFTAVYMVESYGSWQTVLEWCVQPNTWIGIHKLVSWVPLSVGTLSLGVVLWVVMALLAYAVKPRKKSYDTPSIWRDLGKSESQQK